MTEKNCISAEFAAMSENESLARSIVSAMVLPADPTIEMMSDIRTAVSEAVTNCIIHGYKNCSTDASGKTNLIRLRCIRNGFLLDVFIEDYGCGIADIETAMKPLYTSAPEQERSGLGFTVMESFMDHISVESEVGKGTLIHMRKNLDSSDSDASGTEQ